MTNIIKITMEKSCLENTSMYSSFLSTDTKIVQDKLMTAVTIVPNQNYIEQNKKDYYVKSTKLFWFTMLTMSSVSHTAAIIPRQPDMTESTAEVNRSTASALSPSENPSGSF